MAKVLRVIEPFFTAEFGDLFEYSDEHKAYVSSRTEEFYKVGETSVDEIRSKYNAEFQISIDYAKELIEEGYLEEATEKETANKFVNIFDEIDRLKTQYEEGLKNIDQDMAELPACVKVERQTVLSNMITLLDHLKSLKK